MLEIAHHRIGGADVILFVAAVVEVIDTTVLQIPADDTDNAHILRETGNSRAQPASIADNKINMHARLRSEIEFPGYVRILEGVHLQLNETTSVGCMQ